MVFNTFGLMNRFRSKYMVLGLLWILFAVVFFAGCEKDSDGPLNVSKDDFSYDGDGFFAYARLDSGKTIHLAKDTLYLDMGKMWTFSNCALKSIDLHFEKQDSVLWIAPTLSIHATAEDCAAPYYRPDTTLKLLLPSNLMTDVGVIKVKNDTLLDSIVLRRGTLSRDTFEMYLDSSFADVNAFPLRTKEKKHGPTVLRVLDSLTPRVFYWRTMKSTCTHRVDMCKNTVPDTVYPSSWNINDTNLVPVHYACADSDSVYCINSKWENDSTELGKLQERPDTIWHYSTYYTEKIPECGTYSSFEINTFVVGGTARFIRELFTPDENETFCGPNSKKDWMVYNLSSKEMVVDTDSTLSLDSLYKIWKKATVAPDAPKEK